MKGIPVSKINTQILYGLIYMQNLKTKSNSQKQSRKVAVEGWKGEENRERLVNGYKL